MDDLQNHESPRQANPEDGNKRGSDVPEVNAPDERIPRESPSGEIFFLSPSPAGR